MTLYLMLALFFGVCVCVSVCVHVDGYIRPMVGALTFEAGRAT